MGLYGRGDNTGPTLKLNGTAFKVQGEPGISAYQVAVENGFVGTESQWLASLVGAPGEQGPLGSPMSVWVGTQSAYNALGTWSSSTLYFII